MATTVKELPGHKEVATGNNIQEQGGEYYVSNIRPYPNDNLIKDNTYNISDPSNQGIVVKLKTPPGAGTQTAIFKKAS